VVCWLQDEDTWVDTMRPGYPEQVFDLMTAHTADVAQFVTVGSYYAQRIAPRLGLDPAAVAVVHLGVDTAHFHPAAGPPDVPTVGFLSRMNTALGVGALLDAVIDLRRTAPPLAGLRLRLSGGATPADRREVARLLRERAGVLPPDAVDVVEAFDPASRAEFLRSLSVLSVPMARPEAFGLFLLEALASGIPAVQPAIGGFPEVADLTGGVSLYDPADPAALATALKAVLLDEPQRRELGQRGLEAVREGFSLQASAAAVAAVYEKR
jgi:glycosyltransferase involved in cell wall biosynthesis